MLLLNNDDVASVLTIDSVIDALEKAYRSYARGTATCRPRIDIRLAGGSDEQTYQWGTMEGGSDDFGYFGIRMKSDVTYFTEYQGTRTQEKFAGEPGLFCGLILLTNIRTGEPIALINDGVLQHFRVGADSAIGVKYGAREDAAVLGMLGSGGMARSHVEALGAVRPLQKVVIFSPTSAHREAFAAEVETKYGIEATAVDDPEEVHASADILCGCTDAVAPIIRGEWLRPGTHITTIGGTLDDAARDRVDAWFRFGNAPSPDGQPDWRTLNEAITYSSAGAGTEHPSGRPKLLPRKSRLVDLSSVVSGVEQVRKSPDEITFSERGNLQGLQFFSVGSVVYERAVERGIGRELPREWFLQDIRD